MPKSTPVAILLAFLIVASTAHADPADQAIAGIVVNADQQPVAGATVAPFWFFIEGKPKAKDGMVTDEHGRYEGTVSPRYNTLLVFSSDHQLAGLGSVKDGATITLGPAVRVKGDVTCSELGRPPTWFNSTWKVDDRPVLMSSSEGSEFQLILPRADFTYEIYDQWFSRETGEFRLLTVEPKDDQVELTVDLPAHFLAKHVGKPLPKWNVTAARNVAGGKSQLSDFQGKWVLLEFWGFW